jgi:hypothetical protein
MAIDEVFEFASFVFIDPADTDLILFEFAVVLAEQADNSIFSFFFL